MQTNKTNNNRLFTKPAFYFHVFLAFFIIMQYVTIDIASKHYNATATGFGHVWAMITYGALYVHIYFGVLTLITLILNWGIIFMQQDELVAYKRLFPYTIEGIKCVIRDILNLFKFKFPPLGGSVGLPGFIQGLLMILATITALLGLCAILTKTLVFDDSKDVVHTIFHIHEFFGGILQFIVYAHILGALTIPFKKKKKYLN